MTFLESEQTHRYTDAQPAHICSPLFAMLTGLTLPQGGMFACIVYIRSTMFTKHVHVLLCAKGSPVNTVTFF